MRFQLLLVGIATIVCVAIGGMRLRTKLMADSIFTRAERDGRWVMVTGGYGGLHMTSGWGGDRPVPGFGSVQTSQSWDVSPDFERVATLEYYGSYASYGSNPGIKVFVLGSNLPLDEVAAPAGGGVGCPRFDEDEGLLFLESRGTSTTLRRLEIPGVVRDVPLATPIRYSDCFDLAENGERLAWVGTDGFVHVARRVPGEGYTSDHRTFPGNDFALSPDGARLALSDATGVSIIELDSGSRRLLPMSAVSLVDFSPDGTWLSVIRSGAAMSGRTFTAIRIGDGTEATLRQPPQTWYGAQPGQAPGRWMIAP